MGDAVILISATPLGKKEYRLGLVKAIFPDSEGVVRTVRVGLLSRRRRARVSVQGPMLTEEVIMAVQRLAVILPVEETWEKGVTKTE